MASEASERMMSLLSELAALKRLNKECETNSNRLEEDDEQRQLLERHEEITQDIKALAEQKTSRPSS
jgi:hypothetical protein